MHDRMPQSANLKRLSVLFYNLCIHLWRGEIDYLLKRLEAVARYYRFFLHKCPFCGTRFNRFLNKCNGYALLACPHCSLAYVAPSPAHSELDRIYSSAGYYEETIWGGGMTAQSYEDAMRGREWLLREIQFDRYEKRLGEEKRMLEIGSFDGSHLQLFKNRGWQVEGLEIVASIAQKAINRGIITYTKRLEDEHLQRARYDFVTMNHTLEHIHNPGIVMREVWGILKPSGRLIIQVPQEKPSYQPGGQHLLFFTAESMKRLLILSGFEVLALISKQHYNVNVKMDWIELNAYVEKRAA